MKRNDPTGHLPDCWPMNLVAVRTTDSRDMWHYHAMVVNHTQLPWTYFGPNEHDIVLVVMKTRHCRSIVIYIRYNYISLMQPDSDSPCPGGPP